MSKNDKPERIRTLCGTCGGKGTVTKQVRAYDSKRKEYFTSFVEETCNTCAGMKFVWH